MTGGVLGIIAPFISYILDYLEDIIFTTEMIENMFFVHEKNNNK